MLDLQKDQQDEARIKTEGSGLGVGRGGGSWQRGVGKGASVSPPGFGCFWWPWCHQAGGTAVKWLLTP